MVCIVNETKPGSDKKSAESATAVRELTLDELRGFVDESMRNRHGPNRRVIKDIDGEIAFMTEVRAKNGYLLVFNAWRQKKARSRRPSNAARRPQGTDVRNVSTHNEPIEDITPSLR